MKWLNTALLAAGGCLAAAPLKLTISPPVDYPLAEYETVKVFAVRVRNTSPDWVNVTLAYNQSMTWWDETYPKGSFKNGFGRAAMEKIELRSKATSAIASLFESPQNEEEGQGLYLHYLPPIDQDHAQLVSTLRSCLMGHGTECDFDQWEADSECRPVIRVISKVYIILLDYAPVFEKCQPGDLQADVEYVAKLFSVKTVKVDRTNRKTPWPLLERLVVSDPAPSPRYYCNDPLQWDQWYLHEGRVDGAANLAMVFDRGRGVYRTRVAVISSGGDLPHPDMMNWPIPSRDPPVGNHYVNLAEFYGEPGVDDDGNGYIDDTYGWTAGMVGQPPYGSSSLGQEMGGMMGAIHDNGIGITSLTGFESEILHCQRYHDITNKTSDAYDRECFDYAAALRADVVLYDNVWSSTTPQTISPDLKAAFDRWLEMGKPIFMPANNNKQTITCSGTSYSYPACWKYPNHFVISTYDQKRNLSNNSDKGSIIKTAAPGSDIMTTIHRHYYNWTREYASLSDYRYGAAWMAGATAVLFHHAPWLEYHSFDDLFERFTQANTASAGTKYGGMPHFYRIAQALSYENMASLNRNMDYGFHSYAVVPRPLAPGQYTHYWILAVVAEGATAEFDGEFLVYTVNGDLNRLLDRATAHFGLNYDQQWSFYQIEGDLSCQEEEYFDMDLSEFTSMMEA